MVGRLTLELLDPVVRVADGGVLQALFAGDEGALEHGHDAVQKAVDDFEATGLAAPCGRKMALVTALPLQGEVLVGHVADFEDLHRHRVVLVFADRLQETGQQACAHHLELERLGVGQLDRRVAVVLAVQPAEVLVVRAQDQRHNFRPAGHGGFHAYNVRELVDWEGLRDRAGLAREGPREVVESVRDRHVLHDVGLVKHVGAGRRDEHVDHIRRRRRWLGVVRHLPQQFANLGGGELEATALVDVGNLRLSGAGGHVWGDSGLVVVVGDNLNGLDPNQNSQSIYWKQRALDGGGVLREGLSNMLGEHRHQDPVHDLHLGLVKGRDLNEHILSVDADLRMITVDNRRKGADGLVRIKDYRIDWRVANDVKILAQVPVFLQWESASAENHLNVHMSYTS